MLLIISLYPHFNVPTHIYQMISILSGCLSILHMIKASSFSQDESLLNSVQVGSMKARHLISTICHADSAPWKYSTSVPVEAWRSFPLPSNWQNGFHEAISLRAYNLCVSCCVSSFSGWEPNEFNLDQLRSSDEVNLFLVSLEGPSSAGKFSDRVSLPLKKRNMIRISSYHNCMCCSCRIFAQKFSLCRC